MPRPTSPRLIPSTILILCTVLAAVLFRGRLFSWVANGTSHALAPFSNGLTRAGALVASLSSRGDLARQLRELQDRYHTLSASLINQDELQQRLQFYRGVANIREHLPGTPFAGNIFSYTRAGGVYQAILNRGSDDGVAIGDVVATANQEFIGVIEQVSAQHSVVRVVGDAVLEVTARVLNSNVAGLIRSERGGKVVLDLVQKDETVVEGATIITSGDDRYPAGLIIGTVRSVDSDAATLFQIVRVTPSIQAGLRGAVLVIRP